MTAPMQPKKASAWSWLVLAGLLEIGFATALKLEKTQPQYLYVFLICSYFSFECLSRALKTIPLGTAYAIWTGIGSVGAVLVGVSLFGESLSPARALLLLGLIVALIALKMATPREENEVKAAEGLSV